MKTEREYIEAARDLLRKAESDWQKAIDQARGVVAVNADPALANAAFGAVADLTEELANMRRAHWRVTNILLENWPQYAEIVTEKGPGGR